MSLSMNYIDTDKLEVFLGKLETDSKAAGDQIQEKSAVIIKSRIEGQLNRIRSGTKESVSRSKKNNTKYKHMADDVKITKKKDEFGERTIRVQGGKKTGTLWHIVNDGTYRTNATHFMDKAMKEAEPEIQAVIDAELSKVGD